MSGNDNCLDNSYLENSDIIEVTSDYSVLRENWCQGDLELESVRTQY